VTTHRGCTMRYSRIMRQRFHSIPILFMVLAGLACARPALSWAQARAPIDHAKTYVIGPGDLLDVFVWQNPDLSQKAVPVRPDGRISTPLVPNIVAAGRTPVQLAHAMDKVLAEYIRDPKVTIIVERALSVLSQVQVIGQVMHPMSMPYHEGMTVLDVVLAAGGLTPYAAGNDAKIEREVDGHVKTIHVHLYDLIDKGELSQNLPVKPGDVLVVPESFF
jgi:polysaccharide export outer membrane protein